MILSIGAMGLMLERLCHASAWYHRDIAIRKKAIMQRGSIEHEQIIYESSNRRMKQLMDWLSSSLLDMYVNKIGDFI